MSQTDTALADALTAATQAIKGGAKQGPELTRLLQESKGTLTVDGEDRPYYRYAFVAADWLYSNPKHIVKATGLVGATYADLIDSVTSLLRRQIRLDATSGAVIPDAMSAQKLLDEVLGAAGKAPVKLRRATLQVL